MAKAEYIQRGESLDYINETEELIEAGDIVVMGGFVGVAGMNIRPGAVGSLHVMGVYAVPKGAEAVAAGDALGWDDSAGEAAAGADPPLGYAVESADADAETVKVLLDRSAAQ